MDIRAEAKSLGTQAMYEVIHKPDSGESIPFCSHLHVQGPHGDEVPAHYHEYIEIIYVLEGSFLAAVNGHEFSISDNDLLLVNSSEPHAFRRFAHCRYICLQFDPQLLFSTTRTTFEARYIMPFIMSSTSPQRVVPASEMIMTNIGELVENANREFTEREYGYELAVRADICRIFLWYLRKWHAQGVKMGISANIRNEDFARLENVLKYIDDNYMHSVSAEKMAALCNMSYSYFSRFFKSTIGKTFSEYLTYVRVTEAEKLLVSSALNVSQIAINTGFSNASYFITQFKRNRNMTPKKFKQRLLIDTAND